MNQILLIIAVVTFIIYVVFNIIYLIDLRKTSVALRHFVVKTEENLNPALHELSRTLQEIRKVTYDVSSLVESLRVAIGAIVTVEKGIRSLYGYYKEGLAPAAQANMASLRAGVKAGVINLFKNLKKQKEGSS